MATKSLKRQMQNAVARYQALRDEVYAVAPNNNTPFHQCLDRAPAELRERFMVAGSHCDDIEAAAISAGKAYHSSLGLLTWYR